MRARPPCSGCGEVAAEEAVECAASWAPPPSAVEAGPAEEGGASCGGGCGAVMSSSGSP